MNRNDKAHKSKYKVTYTDKNNKSYKNICY